MLSKLNYYRSLVGGGSALADFGPDLMALQRELGVSLIGLRKVASGTLGAGFLAQVGSRGKFFKTYAIADGRRTLEKEFEILAELYGARIHLERIAVFEPSGERVWLMMDQLYYPTNPYNLAHCADISSLLQDKLKLVSELDLADFSSLLEEGQVVLASLQCSGFLKEETAGRVASILMELEKAWPLLPRLLCHGDFGPMNIMCDEAGSVVIDWEDAFIAFPGYDYLYWLTFFQNRQFYVEASFGRSSLGKRLEIAVMVLVVLVKCEISRLSARYGGDQLTFDQRLSELLSLT